MSEVFISYSRKNSDFAHHLVEELEKSGRETWIDWEAIPISDEWWLSIQDGIDSADNFVFIMSPVSLSSPVCTLEIAHAIENGKRIIPVIYEDFDNKIVLGAIAGANEKDYADKLVGRDLLEVARENLKILNAINWLQFHDRDEFDVAFKKLLETIEHDLEHAKTHTRLLIRAKGWQDLRTDPSLLLSGNELRKAENWLEFNRDKDPYPTPIHKEYIVASVAERERQIEEQRRRRRAIQRATVFALVIVTGLGLLSFGLFRSSEANLSLADARGTDVAFQANTAQANANLALTQAARADHNAATSDANAALAATNEANANRQADISQSQALAAFAERAAANNDMDKALALAVKAVEIPDPPIDAQRVLNEIVFAPGPRLRLQEPREKQSNSYSLQISQVAFSPDGTQIVTGAGSNVRYWDARTGAQIFHLGEHTWEDSSKSGTPFVTGTAFSSDGNMAVTVGADDIRFWDLQTGMKVRQIELGIDPATAAFSKDWHMVLLGNTGGNVQLWNLDTGTIIWRADKVHKGQVWSSTLSPDGKLAITGDYNNEIVLWDVLSGKILRRFSGTESGIRFPDLISYLSFSPDGRRVFATSAEGYFVTLDTNTGEIINQLSVLNAVDIGTLSADQRYLAVAYQDHSIALWDLSSKRLLHRFTGHTNKVSSLSFSPDASQLVSASWDGTARIWDLNEQNILNEYRGHKAQITSLSFNSDGTRFVSSAFDGSARIWDTQSGMQLGQIKLFNGSNIINASYSPKGDSILVTSVNTVSIFDSETGADLIRLQGLPIVVVYSFYRPDGMAIFTVGYDRMGVFGTNGQVQEWDAHNGRELFRFANLGTDEGIFVAAISADSHNLISPLIRLNAPPQMMNAFTVWDATHYTKLYDIPRIDSSDMALSMIISPDGQSVAYATGENVIRVRSIANGNLLSELHGPSGLVLNIAFVNNQSLVSVSKDGSIRLWDITTGQELRHVQVPSKDIRGLAVAPDLSSLIVGDSNGLIRRIFWSPNMKQVVDWAHRNRYVRDFTCGEKVQYNILPLCESGIITPTISPSIVSPQPAATIGSSTPNTSPTREESSVFAPPTCSPIILEETYDGSAGIWSFESQTGDSLSVTMESDAFDPYLILKDLRLEVLAVNDDVGVSSNTASIQNMELAKPGTYFIVADGYGLGTNDTGAYRLTVVLHRKDGTCLTNLEPHKMGLLGLLVGRSDPNLPVRVTTLSQGGNAHRAGLQLYDLIIAIDAHSTISITDRAVRDLYRMPVGASVRLTVLRGKTITDLTVVLSEPIQTPYEKPVLNRIGFHDMLPGTLGPGESTEWLFEGEKGQSITILVGGNGYSNHLRLISPNGTVIADSVKFGDLVDTLSDYTSIIPFATMPETGTYRIMVRHDGTAQGYDDYFLTINQVLEHGVLPSILSNADHLSPIEGGIWKFEGAAGQVLNLTLQQKDSLVDAYMMLVDPDGNIVGHNLDYGFIYEDAPEYDPKSHLLLEIRDLLLPKTGTYHLIVNPHIHSNPVPEQFWGSYSINMRVNTVESLGQLKVGDTVHGDLAIGATDFWVLTASSGKTVQIMANADNPVNFDKTPRITIREVVEQGYFDTIVELYDSQFKLLVEDDFSAEKTSDGFIKSVILPNDGTYIIAVRSGLMRMTGGKYSLIVTDVTNPKS